MPNSDKTVWLWSTSLPRWYRNGGVCAGESTLHGIRREPDRLVRWKPTIWHVCGSLMGTSRKRENGSYEVKFPRIARRLAIYEEGLNLVALFRERDDLLTLAVYRRQVHPVGAISLDARFLELADSFNLSVVEWEMLAVRMPEHSSIRTACEARTKSPPQPVRKAA